MRGVAECLLGFPDHLPVTRLGDRDRDRLALAGNARSSDDKKEEEEEDGEAAVRGSVKPHCTVSTTRKKEKHTDRAH